MGAELTWLGSGESLDADLYALRWGNTIVPEQVGPGETFTVLTRLFNQSQATWPNQGGARVRLAYHWRTLDGRVLVQEGLRTELPAPGAAGRPGERQAGRRGARGAGPLHPGAGPGFRDGLLVLGEERRNDFPPRDRGAFPVFDNLREDTRRLREIKTKGSPGT